MTHFGMNRKESFEWDNVVRFAEAYGIRYSNIIIIDIIIITILMFVVIVLIIIIVVVVILLQFLPSSHFLAANGSSSHLPICHNF